MRTPLAVAVGLLAAAGPARAGPELADPGAGLLELVTPPESASLLDRVDGLAFDRFGNLFAALELPGLLGGVVVVDVETGLVEPIARGIPRADQVALRNGTIPPIIPRAGSEPGADAGAGASAPSLVVTSEVSPAASSGRLFQVFLAYDSDGQVAALTGALPIGTRNAIDSPEGLVVIESDGPFGPAETIYVGEDIAAGRILRVDPDTGTLAVLGRRLSRPEGLAFGDFGGDAEPALYVAETTLHRLIRIDPDETTTPLEGGAAVGLSFPDNLEFGLDGFLYVSEDRPLPQSRIVRVAVDGAHEVFATGFGQAAGLAFHPETGDLYVSEQDFDRIWRVRFTREIRIDVKPGSPRNRVRPGSRGVVPVAIFGAEDLDAREIDATSLAFGPDGAPPAREPEPLVDLDGDGREDLRAHFRVAASGISAGEGLACVRGALLDGRPLRGCDAIETVPPSPPRAPLPRGR